MVKLIVLSFHSPPACWTLCVGQSRSRCRLLLKVCACCTQPTLTDRLSFAFSKFVVNTSQDSVALSVSWMLHTSVCGRVVVSWRYFRLSDTSTMLPPPAPLDIRFPTVNELQAVRCAILWLLIVARLAVCRKCQQWHKYFKSYRRTQRVHSFYRAALNAGRCSREKGVRLSVKRVNCDKTEERSVNLVSLFSVFTSKRSGGNYLCTANWGRATSRQLFSALHMTPNGYNWSRSTTPDL